MDINKTKTQSSLKISEEVVSTIAKTAIKEIDGVSSLSTLPIQYNKLKTQVSPKAVRAELLSDTAKLDIAIVVKMNHRIKDVCEEVQTAVKDAVQNMASITVSKVNVFVTGVAISTKE